MAVRKRLELIRELEGSLRKHFVDPEDFKKAVGTLVDALKTFRSELDVKIEGVRGGATKEVKALTEAVSKLEKSLTGYSSKGEMEAGKEELRNFVLLECDALASKIPDLSPFLESFAEIAARIPDPESPESIRNKLESIEEEEEKLSIEAIKNLRKELDELRKARSGGGGGVVAGRELVKSYDLSPNLDGSTKVFAIPGNWTVLSVSGTSFPYTFRRLVDYTFTQHEITFTDEITAAASLAEGQTIEILYVTA